MESPGISVGLVLCGLLFACTDEPADGSPDAGPAGGTPTIAIGFEAVAAGIDSYIYSDGAFNAPGGVFTDLDGDGDHDLYLVQAFEPNLLLFNDGAGAFVPASPQTAMAGGHSQGAIAADYDNDGDKDLYVIQLEAPNILYRNAGAGKFEDVTELTDPTPEDGAGDRQLGVGGAIDIHGRVLNRAQAVAWVDVNRDGTLDLFVANHQCCGFGEGMRDVLYVNNGDGTFTDATERSGLEGSLLRDSPQASSMAATFADFDRDGWPDLYLTHISDGPTRDELFMNDGDSDADGQWDGTFSEFFAAQDDAALGNASRWAMGVAAADYDNDGDFDIYVGDIGEGDLYRNLLTEQGTFGLELVQPSPAPAREFQWAPGWLDVDNDGDLDLQVVTNPGSPNYLYENLGDGVFRDVATAAGVDQRTAYRVGLHADFDDDGWVDVFMISRDTPSGLYRNVTGRKLAHHWLQIDLVGDATLVAGKASTRDAIGAVVEIAADVDGDGTLGDRETQYRAAVAGEHLLAASSASTIEIGLGLAEVARTLRVLWPSGRTTTLRNVPADQRLSVVESETAR